MKKSMFAIITFSSTLLFFALACKKNSPPPEPVSVKFSPEAFEYVKLSPGKYLIYKDSASGVLDSVVVTQSSLEARLAPATVGSGYFGLDCPEYNYESFTLTLTNANGNPKTWFTGRAISTEGCPYYNSDTAALFLREPDNYYAFSSVIAGNTDNYLIPSLVIEGKTYLNVIVHIVFIALDINDPSYKKSTFYWAKGVGIIKRELIVPGGAIKTHTLLRHN